MLKKSGLFKTQWKQDPIVRLISTYLICFMYREVYTQLNRKVNTQRFSLSNFLTVTISTTNCVGVVKWSFLPSRICSVGFVHWKSSQRFLQGLGVANTFEHLVFISHLSCGLPTWAVSELNDKYSRLEQDKPVTETKQGKQPIYSCSNHTDSSLEVSTLCFTPPPPDSGLLLRTEHQTINQQCLLWGWSIRARRRGWGCSQG